MEDKKVKEVEIDLYKIGSKTVNGTKHGVLVLYDLILRSYDLIICFLLRNRIFVSILILLGIILGFASYKYSKQYYKSEMIAYSSISANSEIIKSINNWNFSREFNETDALKIKDVYASFLVDVNEDGKWDIVEDRSTINKLDTNLGVRVDGVFSAVIEVYDTSIVMAVKEKLMVFLFENKKVYLNNKERLKRLDLLQIKIGDQISLLDSLQRYEYFKDEKTGIINVPGNSTLIVQKKDKRLYHSSIIDLYKQQIELKHQIVAIPEPYDIRVDFSLPKHGLITMFSTIKRVFIKVFLLGFLLIILFDRWKKKKANNKHKTEHI